MFTQGLLKKYDLQTEKQFEDGLLRQFRTVDPSIKLLEVTPTRKGIFRGLLYFPSSTFGNAFRTNWHYYSHYIRPLYAVGPYDIGFELFVEKENLRKIKYEKPVGRGKVVHEGWKRGEKVKDWQQDISSKEEI